MFLPYLTQQQVDAGFAEVVLNGSKEDISFYADFVLNPNIADIRYGRLPIWLAIEGEDSYPKTKIILSLKPNVNVKNNYGQTPAMVALEKRMQGIGVLFLRHDELDITATDNQGNDYMKYAVLSRSPKAVYEAAKRGCALDNPDKEGFIPAYWAVKNKDMDVFRALCECGLNRDINNTAYKKVLKQAQLWDYEEKGNSWILAVRDGIFPERELYELTQDLPSLQKRVERLSEKNQWRVKNILGILGDQKTSHKETVHEMLSRVLIEQCRYGNAEDVGLLLFLGADPNMRDRMGRTPLFCAVNYQGVSQDKKTPAEVAQIAYQKVKLLLEKGANPNLPNVINCGGKVMADNTPLEQSLYLDRVGISILLMKAGAKMVALNTHYPLMKLATIYAKPEAIDALARFGGDLMQTDSDGKSPLEHAVLNDRPYHIVVFRKYLLEQGRQEFFNRQMPQGQYLYTLAEGKNPLITEALNGTLSVSMEKKKKGVLDNLNLDEKLEKLSESEYLKLVRLAGISVSYNRPKTTETTEWSETKKMPARAENRHTLFRQALATFKRNQRAKILMDRVKVKQNGHS